MKEKSIIIYDYIFDNIIDIALNKLNKGTTIKPIVDIKIVF